ncbi:MAG: LytTR family DNA-binding domain-containing protein [Bacteroidota bacterium]|nr:LytTR family DNA-binding domain-containing protein [Bacteroidota bacterium]
MSYKCLIVDDDPMICDLLQHFASKTPQIEYCISASNGTDALKMLSAEQISLIFLDFNLPDMKGQVLLELKQDLVPVIMVTSHEEFAAQSYEYEDVIDFLVKPISFDRFTKAIQRLDQKIIKPVQKSQESIFIKDGSKLVRVNFNEILYLKSEENYVSFVTPENSILSLMPLKEVESKLPKYFQRVHRSYIVNLNKIDFLTFEEIVIKKHHIPIGQKYKKELLDRIEGL